MTAKYTTKDQNHADETTIYWFEITEENSRMEAGETFGASDCNGEITYVDCDGCPVCPEDEQILKNILVITQEMIND